MKHQKIMLAFGLSLVLSACGNKEKDMSKTENTGGPAVIYDGGGKFDKSFNESAYNGAEAYKKETGKSYLDFEMSKEADYESILRKMAQRGGNPIVTMGFSAENALTKIAPELPNNNFVIVDGSVDAPNVKSISFREEEGSFLVGALAAMKSTTGKIGFIGGMDNPVIRRFSCGFEQGIKHINPKAVMISKMTSTNSKDAWSNPSKGSELANSTFDAGADVIFAVAGSTGNGVYQAAKDAKKLAIGVDTNQNHLFPGTMLTSMVKRVDTAILTSFKESDSGTFKSGLLSIGLKDNGVDWALDEHNRALVTPEMETKTNQIKKDIIDGRIKISCQ